MCVCVSLGCDANVWALNVSFQPPGAALYQPAGQGDEQVHEGCVCPPAVTERLRAGELVIGKQMCSRTL